jgi:hypothetical protein
VEEAELAEHRADAAHLEHHPLDGLVAAGRILRDQLAGLVGEIQQDRAGFEQRERLAVRAVRIDDRGDLVVRVQRQERGRELVVGVEAHEMRLVGQAGFLEHDRHLDAVRRRQRVELDAVGMLGGPLFSDREIRQVGHDGFVHRDGKPRDPPAMRCGPASARGGHARRDGGRGIRAPKRPL